MARSAPRYETQTMLKILTNSRSSSTKTAISPRPPPKTASRSAGSSPGGSTKCLVPGSLGQTCLASHHGVLAMIGQVVILRGGVAGKGDPIGHRRGQPAMTCSAGTSKVASPLRAASRRSRYPGSS